MKKFLSLALVALLTIPVVNAQYRENAELHASHDSPYDGERKSPNRSAETMLGSNTIVIEWSAPSVRDRDIFKNLIPAGKVWRTGANEATVIHFDNDVTINGEPLAAGNYALFSIGSAEEFTFIFNSVSQTWGAFSHKEADDVLRVTVPTGAGDFQEELLLGFHDTTDTSTNITLSWATITASVSVATE